MHQFVIKRWILSASWALMLALSGCVDRSSVRAEPTAALPCPPWVEYPPYIYSNVDSIYLGCVNAVNLSDMVERPDDLVQGRALGPASGERESLGVGLYNQGKISAAKSAGSPMPTIIMPNSGGGSSP